MLSKVLSVIQSLAQEPNLKDIRIDKGPPPANLADLQTLITRLIGLSVPIAFACVTVVLAVAGYRYLTSGGDSKAISSAHQAIIWALLGVLFLAIAWLVLLLIEAFTGVKVTQFNLSFPTIENK